MSQAHLTFSGGGADMIARARHPENPWVEEKGTFDPSFAIFCSFSVIIVTRFTKSV